MTPVLEVDGLRVEFPRFGASANAAIDGIDLAIGEREVVGLVGESGSGKSTLARAIMHLVPPPGRIAAGAVHFEGIDLGSLAPEKLRQLRGHALAMIVANPRGELNPLLTVGRQIGNVLEHHLRLTGRAQRERVLELLREVRIPDPERRIDAYPHELSGGMAQRVVIAIALACEPRFVISDDATSGLDVTVQAQVLDLLRRLAARRRTALLFITRDIGITAHFCDRIAIIYGGQIVELATRAEFFRRPLHPYTCLLMAAFAHNSKLRGYWLREVEAAATTDTGCRFAARCVRAEDRCRAEAPQLREIAPGHLARCHFPVQH